MDGLSHAWHRWNTTLWLVKCSCSTSMAMLQIYPSSSLPLQLHLSRPAAWPPLYPPQTHKLCWRRHSEHRVSIQSIIPSISTSTHLIFAAQLCWWLEQDSSANSASSPPKAGRKAQGRLASVNFMGEPGLVSMEVAGKEQVAEVTVNTFSKYETASSLSEVDHIAACSPSQPHPLAKIDDWLLQLPFCRISLTQFVIEQIHRRLLGVIKYACNAPITLIAVCLWTNPSAD